MSLVMKRRFIGMITFTHPDTEIEYPVDYHGTYIAGKIGASVDTSYPPEWDINFSSLPKELYEYIDLLRNDVLNYEESLL